MDLVVHEVQQLEDVDVADRDRVLERLAGAAVEQPGLAGRADQLVAVPVRQRGAEQAGDLLLAGAVEDRGGHVGAWLARVGADARAAGPSTPRPRPRPASRSWRPSRGGSRGPGRRSSGRERPAG